MTMSTTAYWLLQASTRHVCTKTHMSSTMHHMTLHDDLFLYLFLRLDDLFVSAERLAVYGFKWQQLR